MDICDEKPFGIFEWDDEKNAANIRKHGSTFGMPPRLSRMRSLFFV